MAVGYWEVVEFWMDFESRADSICCWIRCGMWERDHMEDFSLSEHPRMPNNQRPNKKSIGFGVEDAKWSGWKYFMISDGDGSKVELN